MVRLYTCAFCVSGKHEKCERGHPVPKGVYGGSSCVCHCQGRSQAQMDADREAQFKATMAALARHEMTPAQQRISDAFRAAAEKGNNDAE